MFEPQKWFPPAVWLPNATKGLINVTFTFTVPIQLILIGGFLLGICGIRPREIGLDPAKLPAAVMFSAIIWAINQIILVIVLTLMSHEIALNPDWTDAQWSWAAGQWIGQLFGNTLLEEVVFRGFVLPQCILLVLTWLPWPRPAVARRNAG